MAPAPEFPTAPAIIGLTLQLYVPRPALPEARALYTRLLGRDPVFTPHDDFLEWPPLTGAEAWIQLTVSEEPRPLTNRLRFGVADIRSAAAFLDELDLERSDISQLPGVVAFLDATDPWGNRLGYYQDLVPSGEQTIYPGSSVTDESLFAPFTDQD
jgi:hypothetical protein